MLRRKFYDFLKNWKATKGQECLFVKGARQIGKTYIIDKFGKEEYKNYIYINFIQNPNLKEIFEGSLAAEDIYSKMSLYMPNIKFIKGDTLIFIDEIQECLNARVALKFLALDNSYDVIASGSLLGIEYNDDNINYKYSVPVGYERQVTMHGLDFEEFLWAIGINENLINRYKIFFDNQEKVPFQENERLLEYLREYIVVGGMPEVVKKYVNTKDYNLVHEEQKKIIDSTNSDIARYAEAKLKIKIQKCYKSIPSQLMQENKKFKYSIVEKGGRARTFDTSINWINNANIASYCYNVTTPEFPLEGYKKSDEFKIYMTDIGLLVAMYGKDMKKAIINDTLTGPVKRGIYENLIADMLIKRGYDLYYYKNENSTMEIEFLIEKNAKVLPIEVKAKNGTTKSLNAYIDRFKPEKVLKLISGNIGIDNTKLTMPLYMAMFL